MQVRISRYACRWNSQRSPCRLKGLAALLAILTLLAGCGSVIPSRHKSTPPVTPVGVEFYLDFLRNLNDGDAVARAEIYDEALTAYNAAPTTTNQLRLALAYGTPGHVGTDPTQSRRLLEDLLAEPQGLLPYEYTIARTRLSVVEQWLHLESEIQRMRQQAQRDMRAAGVVHGRQIEAVQAENEQLRRALSEAQDKLDAVTLIERSVEASSGDGGNQ